jgi:hypothetical protein
VRELWQWIPREWKTSALIILIESSYLLLQVISVIRGWA